MCLGCVYILLIFLFLYCALQAHVGCKHLTNTLLHYTPIRVHLTLMFMCWIQMIVSGVAVCVCSNLTSCRSSRRRLKTSFTSWSPTRPAMCTCPHVTVRSWTGTSPTWSLPMPPRSATSLSSTGTRMTTLSSLAATSQVKCLPAFYLVHVSPHCETCSSHFDKVVVIPYHVGICIAISGINGQFLQFHVHPVSLSASQTHCHSCGPRFSAIICISKAIGIHSLLTAATFSPLIPSKLC